MKHGIDRTERVGDLIQQALAQILIEEKRSDALQWITITGVKLNRDCSYAKVYVSVLEDEEEKIKSTLKLLNQEAKALRYQLAQRVKLRIIPELKFIYDESTAHGFRISTLIDAAVKKTDKK